MPVKGLGPRDELLEMVSVLVVLPTLKAEGLSPGDPSRPQPSAVAAPLLPAEKVGKMPLARRDAMTSSKIWLPPGPPQGARY